MTWDNFSEAMEHSFYVISLLIIFILIQTFIFYCQKTNSFPSLKTIDTYLYELMVHLVLYYRYGFHHHRSEIMEKQHMKFKVRMCVFGFTLHRYIEICEKYFNFSISRFYINSWLVSSWGFSYIHRQIDLIAIPILSFIFIIIAPTFVNPFWSIVCIVYTYSILYLIFFLVFFKK